MEQLLAELWSDVLDVHPIGVHDDYFELGGDSIRCIQIVAAARARGVRIEPRDLFAHPTIAGLAAVAIPGARDRRGAPAPAATASERELAELLDEFGAPPKVPHA